MRRARCGSRPALILPRLTFLSRRGQSGVPHPLLVFADSPDRIGNSLAPGGIVGRTKLGLHSSMTSDDDFLAPSGRGDHLGQMVLEFGNGNVSGHEAPVLARIL